MMLKLMVAVAASAVLGAAAMVGVAAPASADEVWTQGIGRASADAECPMTTDHEAAEGWSPWAPSWDWWPNGGQGGYVCQRSIVWAMSPVGAGCQWLAPFYLDFGTGWSVPRGTRGYHDAACTDRAELAVEFYNMVYAGDESSAEALCREIFGDNAGVEQAPSNPRIRACLTPP
jgi:hypothetical protein